MYVCRLWRQELLSLILLVNLIEGQHVKSCPSCCSCLLQTCGGTVGKSQVFTASVSHTNIPRKHFALLDDYWGLQRGFGFYYRIMKKECHNTDPVTIPPLWGIMPPPRYKSKYSEPLRRDLIRKLPMNSDRICKTKLFVNQNVCQRHCRVICFLCVYNLPIHHNLNS